MFVEFEPREFLRDVKEAILLALEPIEGEVLRLRQQLTAAQAEAKASADKFESLHEWVAKLEERESIAGPAGPVGPQGEKGADGAPGIDGKDGVPGRDGIDGKDGAPGVNGKDGADGINGKDGRDGVDGKDGAPGLNGKDGAAGIDGKDGAIGRDGQPGVPGRDGKDGAVGLNGKDGRDGIDGMGFEDLTIERVGDREFVIRLQQGERIKEFPVSFPFMLYRGVYKPGEAYVEGDTVSRGGCVWVAKADTDETPGEGATNWQMAVKRGRDGKDGSTGARGDKGDPGRDGRDLTQLGPDGSKW